MENYLDDIYFFPTADKSEGGGGSGGIRGISLDTAGASSPFDGNVQASLLDFLVSDHIIYWTNVLDMVSV